MAILLSFFPKHPFIVSASAFGPYKNGFGLGTCSNVASAWVLPSKPTHFGSGSSLFRNPSKYLSSMQNLNSHSFDLCLKIFEYTSCILFILMNILYINPSLLSQKTRLNEQETLTRGSIWSKHVHDFHNKLLFKHDERVEVVAEHWRENSSSGNGKVIKEHKFFLIKDERDTVPTIDFGFGEASSSSSITFVNTSAYGGGDSTNGYDSIDLSLKL